MAIGTPVECFAANSTSTGTTAFSPTANVVAGTVAFLIGNNNGAKTISSISDSKGNTWVADPTATFNDGVRTVNIAWSAIGTTILTSDTITVTWSGAASKSHDTWVQTVTGLGSSSIFDKTAHASASTANPSTGATSTLAQASEIVWATLRGNGTSPSAGAGFTLATTSLVGGSLLEWQIVSATTGLAGTFTQGATAWCAIVATYLGASSGTTATAGLASATASAFNPSAQTVPTAGAASASATAFNPAVSEQIAASTASATATAFNPAVRTVVTAGLASASATAFLPNIGSNTMTTAGLASASATAFNPAVSVTVSAGAATATATAFQAKAFPTVTASTASATATAFSVSFSGGNVTATAGLASATASAFNPTVTTSAHTFHFSPPVSYDEGPINPDTAGLQRRLFAYYQPHARGHNIWKLPDGSYTDDVQPYPLVTLQDKNQGQIPQGQAVDVTYLYVYYGGHTYEIDATEAAALTAAGYGANIT